MNQFVPKISIGIAAQRAGCDTNRFRSMAEAAGIAPVDQIDGILYFSEHDANALAEMAIDARIFQRTQTQGANMQPETTMTAARAAAVMAQDFIEPQEFKRAAAALGYTFRTELPPPAAADGYTKHQVAQIMASAIQHRVAIEPLTTR
jgi:hypothetical protein